MNYSLQSSLLYCIIKTGKIQNFNINIHNKYDINELRKFHNFIKKELINYATNYNNATSLLDIAVGRGGDIQKWIFSKLKYIVGFDNHGPSIYNSLKEGNDFDGAISRFNNIRSKQKVPFIKFYKLSALNSNTLSFLNSKDFNKKYDIVSCQFALHYFAKSKDTLKTVLSLVSSKLVKNGLFIGTATNGDLIKNILNNGDVNIPLLTLLKNNDAYLFNIDSDKNKLNKNYFEIQGISEEYYLLKDDLIDIAKQCNLELVNIESFYNWYNNYKQKLTIYEQIISFLNFSFIFKKL